MASIERRGDSYRVVWRNDGRKEYTTWPAETYAAEAKAIIEGHRGHITADRVYSDMGIDLGDTDSPDHGITLREWCAEWLPSKTRITPGTRERYEQQLRDRIYPAFGDTPLTQITPVMVGRWLNELRQAMGPKTVTRYYSLLHTALGAAVRHGHIPLNPCHATDFVRDQVADDDHTGGHHAVYLTPRQFEILRAQFADRWHPLLDCIIETGTRWSEVTALAAQHLIPATSSAGPRLRVWRAWKEANGKRYLGTTKGRAKRVLPIGADLYATLAQLVDGTPAETFLFRDDDGCALDYDHMYDRVWKPALLRARRCPTHPPLGEGARLEGARGRCRDYGGTTWSGGPCGARVVTGTTRCAAHYGPPPGAVSDCDCPTVLHAAAPSWHDLRHTYAAWLFSDPRMTPLAISRLLGHQQLATTSEIYGDLMPQAIDAAVDAVADARRSGRQS